MGKLLRSELEGVQANFKDVCALLDMYGATPSRGSTPEAPAEAVPPAASSAGRRTAAACGALLALAALTARAAMPRGAADGGGAPAASLRKYVDDDGMVGDDYVHKNWPGLVCNRDDDDSYNWGDKDSVMGCIRGDSYNCEHWGVGAEIAVCNATCNATDERIVEDAMSEYGDEWRERARRRLLKGHSTTTTTWLAPSRETAQAALSLFSSVRSSEAIADMRSWCGDTFTPYLPIAQSKNLAPSRENGKQAAPLQFNGSWPQATARAERDVGRVQRATPSATRARTTTAASTRTARRCCRSTRSTSRGTSARRARSARGSTGTRRATGARTTC